MAEVIKKEESENHINFNSRAIFLFLLSKLLKKNKKEKIKADE